MRAPPTVDQALQFHRAGELGRAESIYRDILLNQPNHADALHLLGMLHHARGNSTEAEQFIRKAILVRPNQPVFHSNLGVVLAAAGKLSAAIQAHRDASALNPNSPETLNNLGVALAAAGSSEEAIDCFKRAIVLQPEYADARANMLRMLNIPIESATAVHTLGDLLHEADRDAEAIHCYRKAIAIDPGFAPAYNNLANLLSDAGQLVEAIPAYLQALSLQPDSPDLLSNMGNALRDGMQRESAMACYARALAIDPNHIKTHNNIGNALCELGQWQQAVESYERALGIDPKFAETLNNLGTALEELGERQRALTLYRRALELSPDSISAPWNIALMQLLQGDYENGWPGYEHRWRQKKQCRSFRNFQQPLLTISAAKGKRVLLHAEQGFGDAIQFCRYAAMVADLGATVILECPAPLVRLFSGLRGISTLIAHGEPLPEFDLQCPLMSLPMVFRTTLQTIPPAPYLHGNASWKARFDGEPKALRVGLVWAGGTNHQKDSARSLKLDDFKALATIPNTRFYSLQVGEPSAQAKSPPPGMELTDWTADLHDFADTAALISQLDLVIAVDTSVAHLAGAIGKPVWILIPFQPDWRWLLDRGDSPWYSGVRLFRQVKPGVWDDPLARVVEALRQLAGGGVPV